MRTLVIASLALLTTPAFAQAPSATAAADPAPRPVFALMDPDGAVNGVDFELAVTSPFEGQHVWSPRARMQVLSASGLGGYATLQGFLATGSDAGSEFSLADPEFGLLYHARVHPNIDVSAHAGLTLPLADDDDLLAAVGLFLQRPSDVALGTVSGTWLRGGASLGVHQGPVFARLDAGIDQHLGGGENVDNSDAQLVHVNAGVGIGAAPWSASVEFQSVTDLDRSDWVKLVGVTGQYHAGAVSPYATVSFSLDDPYADLGDDETIWTIAVGARSTF